MHIQLYNIASYRLKVCFRSTSHIDIAISYHSYCIKIFNLFTCIATYNIIRAIQLLSLYACTSTCCCYTQWNTYIYTSVCGSYKHVQITVMVHVFILTCLLSGLYINDQLQVLWLLWLHTSTSQSLYRQGLQIFKKPIYSCMGHYQK